MIFGLSRQFARVIFGIIACVLFSYGCQAQQSVAWSMIGTDTAKSYVTIRSPSCVSTGTSSLECFVIGFQGNLLQSSFDGKVWSAWRNRGGFLKTQVSCVAPGTGYLHCFGDGKNGELSHYYVAQASSGAGTWESWAKLPGGGPNAVARVNCLVPASKRFTCLVTSTDGSLWAITEDGWSHSRSQWQAISSLAVSANFPPRCKTLHDQSIDCIVMQSNPHPTNIGNSIIIAHLSSSGTLVGTQWTQEDTAIQPTQNTPYEGTADCAHTPDYSCAMFSKIGGTDPNDHAIVFSKSASKWVSQDLDLSQIGDSIRPWVPAFSLNCIPGPDSSMGCYYLGLAKGANTAHLGALTYAGKSSNFWSNTDLGTFSGPASEALESEPNCLVQGDKMICFFANNLGPVRYITLQQ